MTTGTVCLGTPPNDGCKCGITLVRCSYCGGQARIADAPCEHCEDGFVQACANCQSEPVDPLFAPACSGACREEWEAKQKAAHPAPIIVRAP